MPDTVSKHAYWRGQKRRIAVLLTVWAAAWLVAIVGAPALNEVSVGGVPLGFWMAQQGAIVVFVVLVGLYAWTSDRADRAAGLDETPETTTNASPGH